MLIFAFLLLLIQCQHISTFTLSRSLSSHTYGDSDTSLFAYAGRGGGGGGAGRGGGYSRGGGGGGSRWRSPSRPDSIPIRFAKTIKIDPNFQTPLADIGVSEKTKKVLSDKGFENMTPIQSQSFDLVYSGVDVVGTHHLIYIIHDKLPEIS